MYQHKIESEIRDQDDEAYAHDRFDYFLCLQIALHECGEDSRYKPQKGNPVDELTQFDDHHNTDSE